jgi:hypothetical protein
MSGVHGAPKVPMPTLTIQSMALLLLAQCLGSLLALAIVSINRDESDEDH